MYVTGDMQGLCAATPWYVFYFSRRPIVCDVRIYLDHGLIPRCSELTRMSCSHFAMHGIPLTLYTAPYASDPFFLSASSQHERS